MSEITWPDQQRSEERRVAIVALMKLPDPAGLPSRKYSYRYGGDKARQPLVKAECERAYYLWRMSELRNSSAIVSVRRYPLTS